MDTYRISYPKVTKDEFHDMFYKLVDLYARCKVDIEKKKLDYFVFFLVFAFCTLLLIIALIVNLFYGRNMRPFIAALAFYLFLCASGAKRLLSYFDFMKYCNKVLEKSGYYAEFIGEFAECDETLFRLSLFKAGTIGFANFTPVKDDRYQVEAAKKDGTTIRPLLMFVYAHPKTDHVLGDFTYIDDVYEQMKEDLAFIEKTKPEYGDYSK